MESEYDSKDIFADEYYDSVLSENEEESTD